MEFDGYRFGTEVAASIFVEVEEVLSPDLDVCFAIFGTVVRIDRVDSSGLVVSERLTVIGISEVSSYRNLQRNNLSLADRGTDIASKTNSRLQRI